MINDGEIPVMSVLDRKWNDDSVSTKLDVSLPEEVSILYC